jgi:transcriptional regulator with XRE-family HTH domain
MTNSPCPSPQPRSSSGHSRLSAGGAPAPAHTASAPGETPTAGETPVPGDLRDQVRRLRAEGGTYRSIAAAAGLAPATVHSLATGRRQPTPSTTRALQNVNSGTLRHARVNAGGTRLRLRALHVMGHGSARMARALGVREMTIRQLVRGDTPTVSVALRDAVTDLYDAWWDKRAPERTRAERSAATAARRRAIAGNWCAGAGLDDDHLDTPGYKPKSKWKPAAGTGTAPDINPPSRPQKNRHARRNQKGERR